MTPFRVLVAGTQQSGKTTLVEAWTGLRGTPYLQNTDRPFESAARWGSLLVHVRDMPAVDRLNNQYPLSCEVRQRPPDLFILMGNHMNNLLAVTLVELVLETTVPILILLSKSDHFLQDLRNLPASRTALQERTAEARLRLCGLHPDVAAGFASRRLAIENAMIENDRDVLVQEAERVSPGTTREIYTPVEIQAWVERQADLVPHREQQAQDA